MSTSVMLCLPSELLDQIWLERCKLGFEPRILQPKWVDNGRFYVPNFYTAQPQEQMTQLCRGARNVTEWNGFYSRILDDPSTGVGGFWWSEQDVLYIDSLFFERLRLDRNAIFMGRQLIRRVGIDLKVKSYTSGIESVVRKWFPMCSQLFFMASASALPASQRKQLVQPTSNPVCNGERIIYDRWIPLGHESEQKKSIPITAFYKVSEYGLEDDISDIDFPDVYWYKTTEGFTALGHPGSGKPQLQDAWMDRLKLSIFGFLEFFIFERDEELEVLNARDLPPKYNSLIASNHRKSALHSIPRLLDPNATRLAERRKSCLVLKK
ncbi:hypothetical protein DHEL01_v211314 [Diaporthe helianthi]|uniref:Uncharacterized protein n=1 Tax=Diaporthe helianthi TaxID=158607 RepID=A0A2P5HJ59_DIAHE|nr:hypothetical protein DHEL01_v211314 [Diaporthe helianthi]